MLYLNNTNIKQYKLFINQVNLMFFNTNFKLGMMYEYKPYFIQNSIKVIFNLFFFYYNLSILVLFVKFGYAKRVESYNILYLYFGNAKINFSYTVRTTDGENN